MQVTRNAKIKSLQTMRNTIKEKSSPTTATSSGQDIQAHVAQSDGDITAPIRPRGEANIGPTKAVQPPSQPIRQPRTPPPRTVRHPRVPTATAVTGAAGVAAGVSSCWDAMLKRKTPSSAAIRMAAEEGSEDWVAGETSRAMA